MARPMTARHARTQFEEHLHSGRLDHKLGDVAVFCYWLDDW